MAGHGMRRRDFMKTAMMAGTGLGLAGDSAQRAMALDDPGATTAQKVPRKKLGATGATIPVILMGGSKTFDAKYDRSLHRAFKLGVDYLDTAQIYAGGQSQKTIAPFLQQVGRDNVWVTSKVKLTGTKMTPDNYKSQIDNCLEDLQTTYLNMFFMHMIEDEANLEPDFIKMGDDLKKSGKTRFFGFSCHHGNVPELMEKAAKMGGIDAIMFRYNFRQYGDVKLNNAIDACKKAGIGLIAMKTQASVPEDQEEVQKFQSKNFTLGQAKLKAVWADERIDAAVSGMDTVELVMENTGAALSPEQLSMNEFMQLQRFAAMTAGHHCLGCNHLCESKIAGRLRVADALRYLMYHECYHDPETARLLYYALDAEERDFESADLAEAIKVCPQGIRIDEQLRRAREVLLA